jgi:hypothetical protein
MENLSGPELVKAVSVSMPGSNVSSILDRTNEILNERVFKTIKHDEYDTVLHLIEYLLTHDLSDENMMKILCMVIDDASFPEELRTDVLKFIHSELFNSVLKFLKKAKVSWFKRVLCCSSKTQ